MVEYVTICEQAARAGGAALLSWVGRFTAQEKGPSDLVTQADFASQEAVRKVVQHHTPHFVFISEEEPDSAAMEGEYRWHVDPLDGTTNYVHRVPHYAVSIALEQSGTIIAGAVFDPVNQECYTAARGRGTYLNGRRIRVSNVAKLEGALVAASFSAKINPNSPEIDQFDRALMTCQAVRRTGSAALNLAYVAAGRFDGFWSLSTKTWDVAAGVLLVEEAGGIVSDLAGGPFNLAEPHPVASCSKALHESFRTMLAEAARN